jgi:integrase
MGPGLRRPQGAALSHNRPWHRPAHPHFPAPGQCPCDDSAAGAGAEIETKIGNHSFRATGITAYLKNGGTLERAAAMANHASTRTTQLYDRRRDEMNLDKVERIVI